MLQITKVTSDQKRIERLIRGWERTTRQYFMQFVQTVKSPTVLRRIRELLTLGNVEESIRLVQSHVSRMAEFIPRILQEAGLNEADSIAKSLIRSGVDPGIAISFDPTHPRAAELMRVNRLQFVQGFTRQQATVTRNALAQALDEGRGVLSAARSFRDSIGLTETQAAAVNNYRRLLEESNADALNRALRDRRFDPSVQTAIRTGDPLSRSTINNMVDRYRARALAARAETIARTENLRIVNEARNEVMEQALEETGMDRARVVRTWVATPDMRTRDTHAYMNGQERGADEPFDSPSGARLLYPGDPTAPASETINCRCVVLTSFLAE